MSKMRSRMISLSSAGRRPSSTGIQHYGPVQFSVWMVTLGICTHLEDIFKASCSGSLQCGNTSAKPPDGITSKRWNLAKTVAGQNCERNAASKGPTGHRRLELYLYLLHGKYGGGAKSHFF